MAGPVKRLLVICLDAGLRQRAFAAAGKLGFAVDAVADGIAATKRFAKDEYEAVLLEPNVFDPTSIPAGPTVISIDPSMDRVTLDRQLSSLREGGDESGDGPDER